MSTVPIYLYPKISPELISYIVICSPAISVKVTQREYRFFFLTLRVPASFQFGYVHCKDQQYDLFNCHVLHIDQTTACTEEQSRLGLNGESCMFAVFTCTQNATN
jgi:hypothetical protein